MNPQDFDLEIYGFHQHAGSNHQLQHQQQIQQHQNGGFEEDGSLLLPSLVDQSFMESVSNASPYYNGSANQSSAWLTPLQTTSSSSANQLEVSHSTDGLYRSYIPEQMQIRWDMPVEPNQTYYTPLLEPVGFGCNDPIINNDNHEEYAKTDLNSESRVSENGMMTAVNGSSSAAAVTYAHTTNTTTANEITSNSRSRGRRTSQTTNTSAKANEAMGEPLVIGSFDGKIDERPSSGTSSSLPVSNCLICGDKATGKHYGAYSCDGCKGFFRRSVRRKHTYSCRYNRTCTIDKDMRNQCRFCRLKKCFRVGMNRAAVQHERDKISNRRSFFEATGLNGTLVDISTLLRAEVESKDANEAIETKDLSSSGPLTLSDVCSAMKIHLFRLINWAKQLECFASLDMQDQLTLLRGNAGELLLLSIVWQAIGIASQQTDEASASISLFQRLSAAFSGVIKASNEYPPATCCLSDSKLDAILRLVANTVYRTLLELAIGETEFICLKAIIFLTAGHLNLTPRGRLTVEASRSRLQIELMNVMNDNQYLPEGRFGELLLLIPTLQRVSGYLVTRIASAVSVSNLGGSNTVNLPGDGSMVSPFKLDDLLGDMLLSGPPSIFDDIPVDSNGVQPIPFAHLPIDQNANNQYSTSGDVDTMAWQREEYSNQTGAGIDMTFHLQPLGGESICYVQQQQQSSNPEVTDEQIHPSSQQQQPRIQGSHESMGFLENSFAYGQEVQHKE